MNRILLMLAALYFMCAEVLAQDGGSMHFIRREMAWGQPAQLQEFDAPPINVTVRSRQISFISVEIADYTRMVPVVTQDPTYGTSRVVMQPTREVRRVEKKNGVRIPGERADMFLLYIEPQSGIHVYFADETAGQNKDVLILAIPETKQEPHAAHEAKAEETPEPPKPARPSDGYLSNELLDWYVRLADQRANLDPKDQAAIQRFNDEAARYQEALRRARAGNAR